MGPRMLVLGGDREHHEFLDTTGDLDPDAVRFAHLVGGLDRCAHVEVTRVGVYVRLATPVSHSWSTSFCACFWSGPRLLTVPGGSSRYTLVPSVAQLPAPSTVQPETDGWPPLAPSTCMVT